MHRSPTDSLVTLSPAMQDLADEIRRFGAHDIAVLIHGETGTGKERVARALHAASSRRRRRFVALNCGGLPRGTALSALFGHERGAFTGAAQARKGAFRQADGGTLFLDEVGELDAELQAALLRVLETKEVVPVGGDRPEPVNFRLIAATHRHLPSEVAAKRFREDLFYRVAVAIVRVPPLRLRRDDIARLAGVFLDEADPTRTRRLSRAALAALEGHAWPGNVRELRNAIQRAAVRSDGPLIPRAALDLHGLDSGPPRIGSYSLPPPAREPVDRQRGSLVGALKRHRGNRTLAARDLGISRSTLYARMKRLGLD